MDIFRFHNPRSKTLMEQGELVDGLKSKMWVERYREGGEFTFVGEANLGFREKLPIGSFISHADSKEIMIVENHEINEERGSASEITISGRGLETWFENRIVGSNKIFPTSSQSTDYILAAGYTWNQVKALITEHGLSTALVDDNNSFPYMTVMTDIIGTSESVERKIKRGPVYSVVLDLLKIDDLGIKIVRPGPWSPADITTHTTLLIYKGVDRTSEVIFSQDTGEIESADYLWTNKRLKNAAYVVGKWVETFVSKGPIEYDRRVMLVDAKDIDEVYETAPTGTDLNAVIAAMNQRGLDELAAQKDISLTKAEINLNASKAVYRQDFDVGDIISVHGNYNEITTMRVDEYVEIEDETGAWGYPTLSTIEQGAIND